MKKFTKHRWWLLTVLMTVPLLAVAAGVPNVFTSGTVISSTQVNDNFKNVTDRLTTLEAASRSSTYVRWGRTVCPTGATVLYTGYAAGGHYQPLAANIGSGVGTICLHDTPQWLVYDDANNDSAFIYGTEYETGAYGVPALRPLQNYDATCVVCEVPRTAELMIPGRTSCPGGWTLEYNGYLMSSHHTQNQSDWSCVDATPEMAGSSANQDGHLFYPTEVQCGSLLCQNGGYVQNREVTCAVCTK
jgi:hypothetical protein